MQGGCWRETRRRCRGGNQQPPTPHFSCSSAFQTCEHLAPANGATAAIRTDRASPSAADAPSLFDSRAEDDDNDPTREGAARLAFAQSASKPALALSRRTATWEKLTMGQAAQGICLDLTWNSPRNDITRQGPEITHKNATTSTVQTTSVNNDQREIVNLDVSNYPKERSKKERKGKYEIRLTPFGDLASRTLHCSLLCSSPLLLAAVTSFSPPHLVWRQLVYTSRTSISAAISPTISEASNLINRLTRLETARGGIVSV